MRRRTALCAIAVLSVSLFEPSNDDVIPNPVGPAPVMYGGALSAVPPAPLAEPEATAGAQAVEGTSQPPVTIHVPVEPTPGPAAIEVTPPVPGEGRPW